MNIGTLRSFVFRVGFFLALALLVSNNVIAQPPQSGLTKQEIESLIKSQIDSYDEKLKK